MPGHRNLSYRSAAVDLSIDGMNQVCIMNPASEACAAVPAFFLTVLMSLAARSRLLAAAEADFSARASAAADMSAMRASIFSKSSSIRLPKTASSSPAPERDSRPAASRLSTVADIEAPVSRMTSSTPAMTPSSILTVMCLFVRGDSFAAMGSLRSPRSRAFKHSLTSH